MNGLSTDFEQENSGVNGFQGVPNKLIHLASGIRIVTQGQSMRKAYIVEEGWAMRYTLLADGRRQILNFMLAGDFCDLHSLAGDKCDHNVETITPVRARIFDPVDILKSVATQPDLVAALWWSSLQEEGILREQIVRNGRRSAVERIAHLILELGRRLTMARQIEDRVDRLAFRLPLTQTMMADALGLSNVHVSRSLKRLRQLKLLDVRGGWARIVDPDALARLADFRPDYLHLSVAPRRLRLSDVAAL